MHIYNERKDNKANIIMLTPGKSEGRYQEFFAVFWQHLYKSEIISK